MASYQLIETVTVGSGGAASISFASIPQTFTDLVVMSSTRSASTGGQLIASVNGSTATSTRNLFGDGSSALGTTAVTWIGFGGSSLDTASAFGNSYFYFPNYALTQAKFSSSHSCTETSATAAYITVVGAYWSSTTAISTLSFATNAGNFAQHSSMSLYGIKSS
jgi:hypothetical protein